MSNKTPRVVRYADFAQQSEADLMVADILALPENLPHSRRVVGTANRIAFADRWILEQGLALAAARTAQARSAGEIQDAHIPPKVERKRGERVKQASLLPAGEEGEE